HRPDLPSFPTRRSSDLRSRFGLVWKSLLSPERSASASALNEIVDEYAKNPNCDHGCLPCHRLRLAEWRPGGRRGRCGEPAGPHRSEEHTSELQSRGHLV